MAGVVGVYSDNADVKAFYMALQTQHRGQENCGMVSCGNHSMRRYAKPGLLTSVFPSDLRKALMHETDYVAIAHIGDKKAWEENIAPVHIEGKNYEVSVAMDGAISTGGKIEGEVKFAPNDAMYAAIFTQHLEKYKSIPEACRKTANELGPSYYSVVIAVRDKEINRSKLVAYRNRRGTMPMYMARTEKSLFVSSESGAVDGITSIPFVESRDIVPGEMMMMDRAEFGKEQLCEPKRAHCCFQWIYSSRVDAVMEGKWSHLVREKTGELLVELYGIKDDGNSVIIGIPDSGRSIALGAYHATNIRYDEGLIKNQYVGRTYNIPDPFERKLAAKNKHRVIPPVVAGKRTHIGDDSIVRGTISEVTAEALKKAGAAYVALLISYAPIYYPCFTDEKKKHLAAKRFQGLDIREIGRRVAKELPSIDDVYYNTPENVIKAIGLPEKDLCTYCITGKNPFENGKNGQQCPKP